MTLFSKRLKASISKELHSKHQWNLSEQIFNKRTSQRLSARNSSSLLQQLRPSQPTSSSSITLSQTGTRDTNEYLNLNFNKVTRYFLYLSLFFISYISAAAAL